jgi:tRNA threonylcarbamoyladenosine biosynthesis protein TsaE
MEKVVISTEETANLAREVALKLRSGDVLALYGNLGTGKTTFTRFLVESLGINAKVQSPSFVLARVYERTENSNNAPSPTPQERSGKFHVIEKVNHLDLYRLQNENELKDLGLEEYFNQPNSITVIEWPELAESFLPKNTKRIYFEDLGEDKRKIYFK